MYQVWIRQAGTSTELLVHSSRANALKVSQGVVTFDIEDITTFTFDIYPGNPGYDKVNYLTTLIRVFDVKKQQNIFCGRVLLSTDNLDNAGMMYKNVTCESLMAFLHDSSQPFQEFTNQSRTQILTALLDHHNTQVEPYKRIAMGAVDFEQDLPIDYCYSNELEDTYNNIKALILTGFEMTIRDDGGSLCLDVAREFGTKCRQVIGVKQNLLSASRTIDPTALITVLKPLGPASEDTTANQESNVESSEEKGTPYMNIETVNEGSLYLRDQKLIDQFGQITKTIEFEQAKTPSELKTLGEEFLKSQHVAIIKMQVAVIDLSLVGKSDDELHCGNYYPVEIENMGVTGFWRISQQTVNINSPDQNTISLGDRLFGQEKYNSAINTNIKALTSVKNVIRFQNRKVREMATETEQYQITNDAKIEGILSRLKKLEEK